MSVADRISLCAMRAGGSLRTAPAEAVAVQGVWATDLADGGHRAALDPAATDGARLGGLPRGHPYPRAVRRPSSTSTPAPPRERAGGAAQDTPRDVEHPA